MKNTMLLMSVLLLAGLVIGGCGEGEILVPKVETVFIGNHDNLVQTTERTIPGDSITLKIIASEYASVVQVDTATVWHFWAYCWGEGCDRPSVWFIYNVDSTTYDTICYERKKCEDTL